MLDGEVWDLSCNGLFFRSDFLDTRGSRVGIQVTIPEWKRPLVLRGQVARVVVTNGRAGMGVQFRDLSRPARQALANFVMAESYR